jgi:hypothetical protein
VVVASLSLGAVAGVLLSAGFIWVEVGRYATPQVPETLFDERREIFAYTAGLFIGVPLAARGSPLPGPPPPRDGGLPMGVAAEPVLGG